MKYKTGLYSWYGYHTPIKERLHKIKTIGFDSIMLWWGDAIAFQELTPEELVEETNKIDLEIENIHVPFENANDIWSNDREIRERIVNQYIKWIIDCQNYCFPMMVMHISKGYEIRNPNENGLYSIDSLVNEAEKRRIIIAIENTRKINLLDYLFNKIESQNLSICYDTSHGKLYEKEEFYILKEYPSKIKCFHISDNDGREDKH